ncbi:hypothetical protein GQX74_003543 [Glossina fuscipes]|uniref:Uncharacterized protein n=1 Tax=Glossina palpalis gambiensis TaxID=67801 RepID=A0A1B0ANT2_9MUSC|nr:hypothetical protein GQX74_003543 [Glossina fuscipes]
MTGTTPTSIMSSSQVMTTSLYSHSLKYLHDLMIMMMQAYNSSNDCQYADNDVKLKKNSFLRKIYSIRYYRKILPVSEMKKVSHNNGKLLDIVPPKTFLKENYYQWSAQLIGHA